LISPASGGTSAIAMVTWLPISAVVDSPLLL
jgi:hypothetical protein